MRRWLRRRVAQDEGGDSAPWFDPDLTISGFIRERRLAEEIFPPLRRAHVGVAEPQAPVAPARAFEEGKAVEPRFELLETPVDHADVALSTVLHDQGMRMASASNGRESGRSAMARSAAAIPSGAERFWASTCGAVVREGTPRFVDGTNIGGSAFEAHVAHAATAIEAGRCEVALITYGSLQRSEASRSLAATAASDFG